MRSNKGLVVKAKSPSIDTSSVVEEETEFSTSIHTSHGPFAGEYKLVPVVEIDCKRDAWGELFSNSCHVGF